MRNKLEYEDLEDGVMDEPWQPVNPPVIYLFIH